MLGDGVEMAHSIEGRLPFLDHKVVELVRSMPVSLKIHGLTEKYVLREAVKQGAVAEENVAKLLKPLELQGWKVEYNVRLERYGDE